MPQYPLKAPIFKQNPESTNLSESSFHSSFSEIAKKAQAANFKPTTTDANHILEVYNQVVKDGRYVKQFASDPAGAATKLGLKLTPTEASEIQQAGRLSGGSADGDPGDVGGILITVGVVLVIVAVHPENQVIVDSSGMIKV